MAGRWIYARRSRWHWAWAGSDAVIAIAAILFSWAVATFPGEWQEEALSSWPILPSMAEWGKPGAEKDASGKPRTASFRDWALNARKLSLHDWLFNEELDSVSRHRFPFSNTLVLTGLNIYEGLGIDDPDKAKWHDFVFRARGRNLREAIFDLATLPKVDFEGANLQSASFVLTQLQSASLKNTDLQNAFLAAAKLQGASLDGAQLQGAFLRDALLQGASLNGARLQGAELFAAQLQGASLSGTQLQGADLGFAYLQGAWLFGADLRATALGAAQLEGATLDAANLEGATLGYANLQGASLQQAHLRATNLSMAFLWRTNRADAERIPGAPQSTVPSDLIPPGAPDRWLPIWRDGRGNVHPWNDAVYQALRSAIESLPTGVPRDQALISIRRVDCANPDPSLASCDPLVPQPPAGAAWRTSLEHGQVDDAAYGKALATTLKTLICSAGDDALFVLRGTGSTLNNRFAAAGVAAPALIDFVMSKDCPLSPLLTDADRARLVQIKQQAEKGGK
jgi:uncharacterized protein YjbI with pentapeptide repeats